MDDLFYLSAVVISIGVISLSYLWVYKLGKRNGAREYYKSLTTNYEEKTQ